MELVVLSGKGGTGKTTIATALSELVENVVKIDCDVDAPNLYLFYQGENIKEEAFYGNKKAVLHKDLCIQCGKCEDYCKFDAVKEYEINWFRCEGCGACVLVCPQKAIELKDEKSADIFITKTDGGIISRAEMEIGSDGSGKLIMYLRKNGRTFAGGETITILDGPPGIGCPVISSITGSDAALVVTEPTRSGLEDFMRVMALCRHFGILTLVCINKYDINPEIAEEIEKFCQEEDFIVVGKIPYDDTVVRSINELKPIVYYEESPANKAIRVMWEKTKNILF